MKRFAHAMSGVWRGTAWTQLPSGEKHQIVQAVRVGDSGWPAAGAVGPK